MLGVIHKQQILDKLFDSIHGLTEVYGDKNFSLENFSANFYCLYNVKVDDVLKLYNGLEKAYPNKFGVYTSVHIQDAMFAGKKLLWRKGTWYI